MSEAESTSTRKELVNQFTHSDLVVLEDLGIRYLTLTVAEDLMEVFVRRYEKDAIMVTSNKPWRIGERCWGTPLP